jgi:hypothetical protein
MRFSLREYGAFREIKKIKLLCEGVHGYVAQVRVPIDAEITEKNRFQMKTTVTSFPAEQPSSSACQTPQR